MEMQKKRPNGQRGRKRNIGDSVIQFVLNNKALLILIILMVASQLATGGKFFQTDNLSSVTRQIVTTAMLGIGFTVVLASGGVDLSVGHMLSFTGIVYAIASLNMPLILAILVTFVAGAAGGMMNGLISEKLRLAPFIVTLATGQIFRGLSHLLSEGKNIGGLSEQVKYIGQGTVFGVVPISLIITIVLAVVMAVVLYLTRYGRHVIATGGNAEAASVSGINISFIHISAYVIMGLFVAVGSIILTGRVSMGQPNIGAGMEMDAIAAVVIGGTPMSGGKARIGGTIFGCLVIGVMSNFLNLMNISTFWQWVAKGGIIILAIIMDAQTEHFFNKRIKKQS